MMGIIHIQNCSKRFGRLQVLRSVNLQFDTGHCIALIGPNGCGKTTLIKSILNMVLPDEGEIYFEGKSIRNQYEYRHQIGYMPQIGRYPEQMSIGQVLDTIRHLRTENTAVDEDLYRAYQLDQLLDKRMGTLSGGTRQKVSATIAFMFRPQVLILDEPTAGLDPIAAEILKEKIVHERQSGHLVLITSHLLSELDELASSVIFMQDGSVRFHDEMAALKEKTGENTLSKAVSQMLKRAIV
jgi:Cu-processing system ATP-binding protein